MSAPRSVSAILSGWRIHLKHTLGRKRATVVRKRGRRGEERGDRGGEGGEGRKGGERGEERKGNNVTGHGRKGARVYCNDC